MATGYSNTFGWLSRNGKHQPHHHRRPDYKYLVGLFSIILCLPASAVPVTQDENTSVAANPQAAISGSVANQAVQINQGALSTQGFAGGHYCNGSVLSFTPYYLQTESETGTSSLNRNFGAQVSVSVPLDGRSVELCKALAQRRLEKERLDYELIRIKECINIFEKGFMLHPSSDFYPICADVLPVAALTRSKEEASSEPEQSSSQ